ncbi:hypothetical protein BGX33_010614 [Mortierella sp. NVP41]|nr:hypothetical protein BGX33_010614 [Mortierella sp. NVP41]
MEDLLSITPDLEELKLFNVTHYFDTPPAGDWSWPRFSKHLQSLSLPLKQFHLSFWLAYPISVKLEELEELEEMVFSVCPNAMERTLLLHHLTPTVVKGLMELPFALTTLDICRSKHTLRITYMIDFMDFHHRTSMYRPFRSSSSASTRPPNQPGIWVCRDLQTLALDLGYHGMESVDDPHHAKVSYGYVSRICPRLQDLQIKIPHSGYSLGHPFDLDRGLCLLSRLKDLERLKVKYRVDCEVSELNWLCASGRTTAHRARRRAIVDGWASRLEEEAVLEAARLESNTTATNDLLGKGADNLELMAGLKSLGLLQDVKDMVEEMDTDGFVCLPELRQVACGYHLEQSPEKEMRSQTPFPTSSSSSSGRPLSPLEIPELLLLIFSYVDRYTMARTVVRVCRQWLVLNQDRLGREVVWDEDWRSPAAKQSLKRLSGAKRLVLRCRQEKSGRHVPDVYGALVTIENPPSTLSRILGRGNKAANTMDLDRPLRELVLVNAYDFKDDWKYPLPFPPSLVSLTIDNDDTYELDIGMILARCPLLESLHLLTTTTLRLQGQCTIRGKAALPDRLSLRSLVIGLFEGAPSWMEGLLTITPNLEELKLIDFTSYAFGESWNWPRFSKHLRSLSLPLTQFHYSYSTWRNTLTDEELEEMMFSICPNATERTLWLYHLTPTVVQGLMELPFALTSLEILLPTHPRCRSDGWKTYHNGQEIHYTARPLHQLLCESANLRHLKSLKMTYMTDFMDLHHRNEMYFSSSSSPWEQQDTSSLNIPGIWVCRGLEELHLKLHFHGRGSVRDSHHSRITFGYVSRVCPWLRSLQVTFPHSCWFDDGPSAGNGVANCHPFILEGGMCLLSRLRYLERLRVECGRVKCEVAELNWLCRSGRTAKHTERRWAIVGGWATKLEEEAVMEAARLKTNSTVTNEVLGSGADDPELMAGLENLGLLRDVKEMVGEMDTNGFVCLPDLRQLACGFHLEQSPERELRSVFNVESPSTILARWKK